MAASSGSVKVVLIDTRYVVTEPENFKSVVQRLTGKDSCVSWIEERSFIGGGGQKRKRQSPSPSSVGATSVAEVGSGEWRMSKGMSFKDLDRMMLEIPTGDELHQLWASIT
ncbi:VQ motif-containing protein 10 [Linum grandiflorum]